MHGIHIVIVVGWSEVSIHSKECMAYTCNSSGVVRGHLLFHIQANLVYCSSVCIDWNVQKTGDDLGQFIMVVI